MWHIHNCIDIDVTSFRFKYKLRKVIHAHKLFTLWMSLADNRLWLYLVSYFPIVLNVNEYVAAIFCIVLTIQYYLCECHPILAIDISRLSRQPWSPVKSDMWENWPSITWSMCIDISCFSLMYIIVLHLLNRSLLRSNFVYWMEIM